MADVVTNKKNYFPNQLIQLIVLFALVTIASSQARANIQAATTAETTRVVTIKLESKLMNAVMPYNVVLPADYDRADSKNLRYPVLYLLHGLSGHYSDWTSRTSLAEYARQYRIIIVTPEGNNGWYTDSATVPSDKYESYILKELIPDVQRRFRAFDSRDGRAIAGLSMGGYGSLKFAIKHRALFVFAGSMSGALGAASWTLEDLKGSTAIFHSLQPVFGPLDSPVRAANDIAKLYREVVADEIGTLPYLYLDCGTEDPLLPVNLSFDQTLRDKKIPHEFRELPGAHNWVYWNKQVAEVLRVVAPRLRSPTVL